MEYKGKILVIASHNHSLVNFRKQMLKGFADMGFHVKVVAPGHDPSITEEMNKIGVEYQSISMGRTGLNPLHDLKTLFELIRLFRTYRPTHSLAYTIKPVIYGSMAARIYGHTAYYAMITGLGYIAVEDNSLKKKLIGLVIKQLYRLSLKGVSRLFFQNPDDIQYFMEKGFFTDKQRIALINGSGVDLKDFPKATPVLKPVKFLLIARMIKAKGIMEYVEAARQLKSNHAHAEFHLIGQLDDRNPDAVDKKFIDTMSEEGYIKYHGYVKNVGQLMSECSVFVLPTFYREGTPKTILEALAMGKPIITTDSAGCRETVDQGRNGFLIPIKNVDELVRAMKKMIENPGLIADMGEASYQLAQEKYDVNKVNRVIFETMDLI